jgi:hypothetical protein
MSYVLRGFEKDHVLKLRRELRTPEIRADRDYFLIARALIAAFKRPRNHVGGRTGAGPTCVRTCLSLGATRYHSPDDSPSCKRSGNPAERQRLERGCRRQPSTLRNCSNANRDQSPDQTRRTAARAAAPAGRPRKKRQPCPAPVSRRAWPSAGWSRESAPAAAKPRARGRTAAWAIAHRCRQRRCSRRCARLFSSSETRQVAYPCGLAVSASTASSHAISRSTESRFSIHHTAG